MSNEGDDRPVDLAGDAYVTLTAPFYGQRDPLQPPDECTLPDGDDIDGTGALVKSEISLGSLLQGSLTYQEPAVDALAFLGGGEAWRNDFRVSLNKLVSASTDQVVFDHLDVVAMVFPDGYGSVAVTLRIPGGWERSRRMAMLTTIGQGTGRDRLAAQVRSILLPPLERTLHRCGVTSAVVLPYFNLTYAGDTEHEEPGRAHLSDDLRSLVYPNSAMPLVSGSPWRDEFFYAGYAFNLLAAPGVRPRAEKLTLLLLILDVAYARLARAASAADDAFRGQDVDADLDWLSQLERRLRADYQALVTPTFSFDFHTLQIRDAILRAWDTGKLQTRTENLIATVRRIVERQEAAGRDRRIRRVNQIVTLVALLSAVQTVDAAISLFERIFG